MKKILSICVFSSLFASNVFGATHVCKVLLLKGEVKATNAGINSSPYTVKKDEPLQAGTSIQVGKNSFVKLIFTDNSQISLGPESKMVVQQYPINKAESTVGVIELVKGKMRAEIIKDPLNLAAKDGKSKLFIKTKSAAMGIRGTQLIVTQNENTGASSCITLEGSVRVAPFSDADENVTSTENQDSVTTRQSAPGDEPTRSSTLPPNLIQHLEEAVSGPNSVTVTEGTFSAVMKDAERPTPTTKISPQQFEGLKNNTTFLPPTKEAIEAARSAPKFISVVPPGMSAFKVAAGQEGMQAALINTVGLKLLQETFQEAVKKEMMAKGMINADGKPMPGMGPGGMPPATVFANFQNTMNKMDGPPPMAMNGPLPGGMIDLNNPGVYIGPAANSLYDPNTKTFAPSGLVAGVDPSTGEIINHKGFTINETGNFVVNPNEFKPGGPQGGAPGSGPMMGPNGTMMGPGGMMNPGGTMMGPGGMMNPGGTMMNPGGTMMGPGGTMMNPGGTMMNPGGTMMNPDGTMMPATYNPAMDPNNPYPQCTTCSTFPTPAESYCSLHPQDVAQCGGATAPTNPASTQVTIIISAP